MKKPLNIILISLNVFLIVLLVLSSAFLLLFSNFEKGVLGYTPFVLTSKTQGENAEKSDFFVVKKDSVVSKGDLIAYKDYTTTQSGILRIKSIVEIDERILTAQNAEDEFPIVVATTDENYLGKVVFSNSTIATVIKNAQNAQTKMVTYVCIFGMGALLIVILIVLLLLSQKKYRNNDYFEEDDSFDNESPIETFSLSENQDEDITIYKRNQTKRESVPNFAVKDSLKAEMQSINATAKEEKLVQKTQDEVLFNKQTLPLDNIKLPDPPIDNQKKQTDNVTEEGKISAKAQQIIDEILANLK
ncbi:MAG: hypothetical protein RR497_00925 [Oscillospiraceae bacterium]